MNLPADFLQARLLEGDILALSHGQHVPLARYESVFTTASANLPNLLRGLHYKAEHVLGANFWLSMSATSARLAGRCFHDMVAWELLPLAVVPGKGATLRYRLI